MREREEREGEKGKKKESPWKNKALFTRVRYRTVPLRSVPKSGTERGCVHTGTEKIKRSVPKQVQKLGGTEK